MTIQKYEEMKKAGKAEIVERGKGSYVIIRHKFDQDTGERVADEEMDINIPGLQQEKVDLTERIKQIDAVLADCD